MSSKSDGDREPGGLRERKKAKTRNAIQAHAIRLFREQGYTATTMEQIAEAAEVSPSTVFRYFRTKEELVTTDEYDPMFFAAFEAQPPTMTVVQAWRHSLHEVLADVPPDEWDMHRHRELLILSVPELWASQLASITEMIETIAELSAKRLGRDPGDPAMRHFAGAMFGVLLTIVLRWVDDPDLDIAAELDQGMAFLEQGLRL